MGSPDELLMRSLLDLIYRIGYGVRRSLAKAKG
jgi:hypothetical protein